MLKEEEARKLQQVKLNSEQRGSLASKSLEQTKITEAMKKGSSSDVSKAPVSMRDRSSSPTQDKPSVTPVSSRDERKPIDRNEISPNKNKT
jgi:hypothetical protein